MNASDLDIVVKLVIGIIGAGSGLITYFARLSFEEMRKSLEAVLAAVTAGKVTTAVLENQAKDFDRRVEAIEHRVAALESEARQIREG